MIAKDIFIALIIHLIIPLTGLLFFLRIKRQMKIENIINAPTHELFIIFSTYGGLVLVLLTTLFWKWSGMASIGTFYLSIIAPILMILVCYRQFKFKNKSYYNLIAFWAGLLYFLIAPLTLALIYKISDRNY